MHHKKFLFLNRRSPWHRGRAGETLEAALLAASFDQEVHLAFLDDGVFQLVEGQPSAVDGAKGVAAGLAMLADAEIDQIWVERQSLEERGLSEGDLAVAATVVDRPVLAELIASMDVVVGA